MNTRYFYKHAHHALCMLLDHGMSFTRTETIRGDGTRGESTRPITSWILARDVENQVSERVRYYLTDESVAMLEPRVGDILHKASGSQSLTDLRVVDGDDEFHQKINARFIERGYGIIQRDGRSFYWPESEAA